MAREYLEAYPQHTGSAIKLLRAAQQQGFEEWDHLLTYTEAGSTRGSQRCTEGLPVEIDAGMTVPASSGLRPSPSAQRTAMAPFPGSQPPQPRYSPRRHARLDAETHAKPEAFASTFHRKRTAILRLVQR